MLIEGDTVYRIIGKVGLGGIIIHRIRREDHRARWFHAAEGSGGGRNAYVSEVAYILQYLVVELPDVFSEIIATMSIY